MALIKCPECGKEISDKSKQCIHCGYPLEEQEQIQNQLYDVVIVGSNKNAEIIKLIKYIRETKSVSLAEAKSIVYHLPYTIKTLQSKEEATQTINFLKSLNYSVKMIASTDNKSSSISNSKDKLTCPRCGSSAVTTGQRGYSLITGFWGSNKTVNRCGKCGYSWQPK